MRGGKGRGSQFKANTASSYLVWDGDTEALKPPFRRPKGIEEPPKVVHQERDVNPVESNVLEGRVVNEWAAAMAHRAPDDSKDLCRLQTIIEEGTESEAACICRRCKPQGPLPLAPGFAS